VAFGLYTYIERHCFKQSCCKYMFRISEFCYCLGFVLEINVQSPHQELQWVRAHALCHLRSRHSYMIFAWGKRILHVPSILCVFRTWLFFRMVLTCVRKSNRKLNVTGEIFNEARCILNRESQRKAAAIIGSKQSTWDKHWKRRWRVKLQRLNFCRL
jgi:hypothetical protein